MAPMANATPTDQVRKFAAEQFGDEPIWLRNRRNRLLEVYLAAPLPVRQRTSLKSRKLDRIPIGSAPTAADLPDDLQNLYQVANLITVNGHTKHLSVPTTWSDQGVILLPMTQAVNTAPQLIEEYLGTVVNDEADKFQALNSALWQDGIFLYVPARVTLDHPITVTHFGSSDVSNVLPRSLVVLDEEARATIIEQYLSEPGREKSLWAIATEIVLKDGAHLQYGAMQQLAVTAESFVRRGAQIGRDAHIYWSLGEFGSSLSIAEHTSLLSAPGGQSDSTTVFFGSETQHQDYVSVAKHVAPHTTSRMVARGVMKDDSRSVFTGVTEIKKGALGTDGRQKEKILMLSDTARADVIPSLLIEENDVFAAHAASAGPVDAASIFYLMSRGLSEAEAIRMVVHGFLATVIDAIPVDVLRHNVWNAVERKIAE